jgi:hypothetical protein
MAKKASLSIGAIFGIIGFVAIGMFCYIFQNMAIASVASVELHPYFKYTPEEIRSISELDSNLTISEQEVDKWIQIVFDIVKKDHSEIDATRTYAYLFTAQRDAAALAYTTKNKLVGSLSSVSRQTICLLLPNECSSIPNVKEDDEFSIKIADVVIKNIKARLEEEHVTLKSAKTPQPTKDWDRSKYYFGSTFGQQITWLVDSGNQFRPGNPKEYDPKEIKLQKDELQKILSSLTAEQTQIAQKWSAGSGTILTSGQWINIANNYMSSHQTPLEKALLIRSILAMGISDASIAYFDAKYTYWKPRPKMIFPDLPQNIKAAKSPSYPSGHATISMAAAIIMDYYFPENKMEWNKTASEIAESRLWGGVHFPIDEHDGLALGKRVGDWIVSKIKSEYN